MSLSLLQRSLYDERCLWLCNFADAGFCDAVCSTLCFWSVVWSGVFRGHCKPERRVPTYSNPYIYDQVLQNAKCKMQRAITHFIDLLHRFAQSSLPH
jgi:hypothetical protein